jgi:signal transduction histidine kinase
MKTCFCAFGILVAMTFGSNAFGKCTKAQAEDAVNSACKSIETKGKAALEELNKLRFCGDNYVWIQDTTADVKMVQHPTKPRLNGTSVKDNLDENKFKMFSAFDKAAKENKAGAWVVYLWAKPGAEKASPKTSFVKLCGGDLKWVAGAGVWKDDM